MKWNYHKDLEHLLGNIGIIFLHETQVYFFLLQTLKEEGRGGGMENEVSSHGSLLSFWRKIYSIYWCNLETKYLKQCSIWGTNAAAQILE